MPAPKPDSEKQSFVLDLETLAIDPRAVVTEIALVELKTGATFNCIINPLEQQENGFVQNQETLSWHLKRDPSYAMKLAHNGIKGLSAAEKVVTFLREAKAISGKEPLIWCQGTDFDIPILNHFLGKYLGAGKNPWAYTNVRDIRTLAALFPDVSYVKGNHTALSDAQGSATFLNQLAWHHENVARQLGLDPGGQ
jgi:hypothetical protein